MIPRPYQHEAAEAIFREWNERRKRSTLLVQATGTGKTVVFAHVADRSPPGRIMVIAHRDELGRQAADKIRIVTGTEPEIEKASERADLHPMYRSRIVVASVQTLVTGRVKRFKPEDFGLLIIDECHHAPASSYLKIIDHFSQNPNLKILGVTATPDRTDAVAMGKVFESVAYVYDIADAVSDGYLVPIHQRSVHVESLDYAKIRTLAGDLHGRELAELMEYERNLHEVAHPTYELSAGRKTLVFAASVRHAERLAEILNRHERGCARWVSGSTPREERRRALTEFKDGQFRFLVNVGVFTEGFDEPGIQVVAIARPTKSRSLYCQMVGRGTRPLPGIIDGLDGVGERREAIAHSSKPAVEIIDFEGNAGKHKLMCVADILGGKYDDVVVQRAREKAAKSGKPEDVAVLLADTEREIQAEYKRREEEEARKKIIAQAEYTTKIVDPFDILDIEPPRERLWEKSDPPTAKQRAYLERNGVDMQAVKSKRAAKKLIDSLIARQRYGRCTFKQAKLLTKYGYDPKKFTFERARTMIDLIASNGWQRPADNPADEKAPFEANVA